MEDEDTEKRIYEPKWKQEEAGRERIRNDIAFIGLAEEIKHKGQVEKW